MQKKNNNKKRKRKRVPQNIVIALASIFIIIGGFFLSYNYIQSKKIKAYDYMANVFYEDTTKENKEDQIKLLESELKIAETYQLPVIIHSREATEDTINTLKKFKVNGVIHSFSGSLETARVYIKKGYLLGVNGVITFKNAKLKEVIKEIPLKNIILETDSPYLTPEPYRGKRNEPARIYDIAKFICDLKGISLEELTRITNDNIKRIFDI